MEGIHSKRKLMGKGGKPEEYKKNNRGV